MRRCYRYLLALCVLPCALTAKAIDYQIVTTQDVATVGGTSPVEYTWRFSDYKSGVELVSVTPKLINDQTLPGYLIVANNPIAVIRIGNGVFRDSPALTKITISDQTLELGDFAFSNCTALATVSLGNSLREIGKCPFVNTRLSDITLPDSLLQMDGNILAGTPYGATVTISDSSMFCYSEDGMLLLNKDKTSLYACITRAEGEAVLPETLTNINANAFFGCFRLTNIVVGASVNTIGSKAFNVNGIWPSLSADESKSKLVSVTYKGLPPANAASDIYDSAPASLVNYVAEDKFSQWPSVWMGHEVRKAPKSSDTPAEEGTTTKTIGSITWTYQTKNSLVTIKKAELSTAGDVEIPEELNAIRLYGGSLSSIFTDTEKVTGVTLSSSVTNIGEYAFLTCSSMSSVDLSAATGLKTIEGNAFSGCSMLGQVEIPDSVREIGDSAFNQCSSLTDIILPQKMDSLGTSVFSGCTLLQSIEMPKSLTYLAKNTFSGCSALQSIALPSNLTTIAQYAFNNCSSLKSITLPKTLTTLGAYAFSGCSSLTEVTFEGGIPSGLKNSKLLDNVTNVNCPAPLAETYKGWLTSNGYTCTVNNQGEPEKELKTDGTWYYHIVKGYAELWCTNGVGEYVCALIDTQTTGSINLPEKLGGYIVKSIAPNALANLRGITSASIPSTYESIGDFAFSNCTSLASVTIPDSVRRLGKAPFYSTALTALTIPASLTALDGNPLVGCPLVTSVSADNTAFKAIDGLLYNAAQTALLACVPNKTEVTVPASVTAVADDAFAGCANLRTITFLGNAPTAGDHVLDGAPNAVVKADTYLKTWPATWGGRTVVNVGGRYNDGSAVWSYTVYGDAATITSVSNATETPLTSVTLPSSIGKFTVKALGANALANLIALTSVSIPSTYETVEDFAFSNCTSLASVTIGSGVTSLGKAPFYGTKITSLSIPASLTTLDGNPLVGCPLVTSVSADNTAFKAIDGLLYNAAQTSLLACVPNKTEVTVPASVTAVADDAFAGCANLMTITFLGNAPTASDHVLDDAPNAVVKADTYLKTWPATWGGRTVVNVGGLYNDGSAIWSYTVDGDAATITSVSNATETPLTSVTFPANIGAYSVIGIAPSAIAGKRSLTSASIPSTYETVGDFAFSNCTSLASVTLGSGVTSLGKAPFYGTKITSLALPNTLTTLDGNPLVGCPLVTSVSADNTAFKAVDGILYNAAQTSLLACVPNKTEVTVPASVTAVADDAFAGCANLRTITFLGNAPAAGDGVFNDTPATMVVKADTALKDWGNPPPATWKGRALINVGGLYNDGNAIWSYTVDGDAATITSISSASESPLTSVSFPANIGAYTVIGIAPSAFAGKRSLTSVSIPATYETVGDYAFSNCTSLASVTISSGVTSFGKAPFYGTKITSLTLPNTLTTLDGNPLVGCPLVTSISADNTAFKAVDGILYNAAQTSLLACVPNKTEITVPASVTAVADDAFAGCANLGTITFLGNAPTAGDGVFNDTPATMVVKADAYQFNWGKPVPTSWHGRTFVNVGKEPPAGIQTYTDENGITWTYTVTADGKAVIGETATAIATLTEGEVAIPTDLDGWPLVKIGAEAFRNCSSITKITIPGPVTDISEGAFRGCKTLEVFAIDSTNTAYAVRNGVLYSKSGSTLVKVPAGFRFATAVEDVKTGTVQSVIEVVNGFDDNMQLIPNTIINNGTKTLTASTTTTTFTPEVSVATLLNGVTDVADGAFADCGYLPVGTTARGTLTVVTDGETVSTQTGQFAMPVGTDSTNTTQTTTATTKSGMYKSKVAVWKTIETVVDTFSSSVPRPNLSGIRHDSTKVWEGSIWEGSASGDNSDAQPSVAQGETISLQGGVPQVLATGLDSTSVKSVSAKGLPTGLKLVKTKDKSTGVYTWTIQGTPTKSMSKSVKLSVSRQDKTKETITLTIQTRSAPAWLSGEFNGPVFADESSAGVNGYATAKVTTAGKVTGKIQMPSADGAKAMSYSFSMKSFDEYDEATCSYSGTAVVKVGKEKKEVPICCRPADDGTQTGVLVLDLGSDGIAELYQNIWKRSDLAAPSSLIGQTIALDGFTVKVQSKGKVKWSGKLAGDNGASVKVSGTSQLFNDGRTTVIYVPPKRNLSGGRAGLVELR